MPDGIYKAEEKLDNDGVEKDKIRTVRVTVEIKGDSISFDFSNSDPQCKGPFNATIPATVSTVYLAFFPLVGSEVVHNAGAMRPIKVIAREGSICNAKEPAACTLNGPTLSSVMGNAVWRALAQAVPERATAGWAYWFSPSSTGINPSTGRPFADIHFLCVPGTGATYGFDGWDHGGNITTLGALRALDPELHEVTSPYTVLQYEIRPDSGGPGRWRGGHGVIARWRIEAENIRWANWGNGTRQETAAFGVGGGKPGKPHVARFVRKNGTKEKIEVNSFSDVHVGDICEIFSAGGGGFGDPHSRPAEKVLNEVINEILSIEKAKDDYGVVIDPKTLCIDYAATKKIRDKDH
jgi:N-methylhydantoinase B